MTIKVKRDKKIGEVNEINLLFEFFDGLQNSFSPPSNRDYSYLLKLVSMDYSNKRVLEDEENSSSENITMPVLTSTLNDNGTVSSYFIIPESLR